MANDKSAGKVIPTQTTSEKVVSIIITALILLFAIAVVAGMEHPSADTAPNSNGDQYYCDQYGC